jgi:drug/metabolite transporter (DMT)-like permease
LPPGTATLRGAAFSRFFQACWFLGAVFRVKPGVIPIGFSGTDPYCREYGEIAGCCPPGDSDGGEESVMKGTWLIGATGVLTLVVAVMLMAYSAPSSSAEQRGPATTQSLVQATAPAATLP